ncbi:dihydroxyacetone kinase subunit DhaL [Bacillus horti]|uniref:Dihydroxyacetone kinase-like protein n=1 Tax=Caldalkalibacillus horti TaxID=77523 RepID=A0ABT9W514_9BACI|nr:dihydroxyacetone kinase subunit DhaL [Bacillus horti]MDQ0168329.1 dihydroxyacetone kinase-like protein [Bacillus horti]
MRFGVNEAIGWMKKANENIQRHKEYLTDLDQATGDGDHGLNMCRGFQEVVASLEKTSYTDIGAVFKDTAMTLLSKVGGASGPLYGTAFLKASLFFKDKVVVDVQELGEGLLEALSGIKLRGKAMVLDKTMIDVWEPAIHFIQANHSSMDWMEFVEDVHRHVDKTKEMQAKKGRATYLGERAKGHIDPGAASSALLFEALAEVYQEGGHLGGEG